MSHFSQAGLVSGLAFIMSMSMLGSIALADTTAPMGENHPCMQLQQQVVSACKAQGFVVGQAKEGTGLYKDCVEPGEHGQTVKGVTADPTLKAACQAKMAERKGGAPQNPPHTNGSTGSAN